MEEYLLAVAVNAALRPGERRDFIFFHVGRTMSGREILVDP